MFDICYDYDVYGAWRATLAGALPVKSFMELVRLQSVIYAEDFIKLRFVENHDQERISHILKDNRHKVLAWTGNHLQQKIDRLSDNHSFFFPSIFSV